ERRRSRGGGRSGSAGRSSVGDGSRVRRAVVVDERNVDRSTDVRILWRYLRPYRWLILLSLTLAGTAQLLSLVDPIIFGRIIDEYAFNRNHLPDSALVSGALRLLGLAVGIAILARVANVLQAYVVNLVVEKFGVQIFDDGIRQTLRLSYEEFMTQRSGETLA